VLREGSEPKEQTTGNPDDAGKHKSGNSQPPAASDGVHTNGNPPTPNRDDKSDPSERITRLIAICALILTGVAAGFNGWQAWIAKDTEERQLRAYMLVDHDSGPLEIKGSKVSGNIRIRHAGVTPAANFHVKATIVIAKYPLSDDLGSIWIMDGNGINTFEYSALYGGSEATSIKDEKVGVDFTPEALQLFKRPNESYRFYMFGSVCNQDVFDKWRQRDFCFSYDASGGDEKDCKNKVRNCPWKE
jgi:hypothetical protein